MGCGSSTEVGGTNHNRGLDPTTPSNVSLAVPSQSEKPTEAQAQKDTASDCGNDLDAKPIRGSKSSLSTNVRNPVSQTTTTKRHSTTKAPTKKALVPKEPRPPTKLGKHAKPAAAQPGLRSDKLKTKLRVATAKKKRKKSSEQVPATLSEQVQQVLCGNMGIECPVSTKVVRIFTSSTFTDTGHERNALMERVYPKLRAFCQEHGYNFQIVDMRWGIRDEATNDHMTTELCMRELRACQKLSTGPNFVTFLSHKYGYRPFPHVIEATEFENLLSSVTDEEAEQLLIKWFRKDDNAVPPAYMLLPISHHLPDFVNKENDEKAFNQAKATWWEENEMMAQALYEATIQCHKSEEDRLKYLVSVTEREISTGILKTPNPGRHCLWFKRNIPNVEQQKPSGLLSRFIDCRGSEDAIQESRKMLKQLREVKLPNCMPEKGIIDYNVPWKDEGINPDKYPEHRKYIDQLCKDFESQVKKLIFDGIQEKARTDLINEPLYEEILQHTSFGQQKCGTFHGRAETLKIIEQYVMGESKLPFVVYGQSGCGKTSIMAKAADMCWEWTGGKCVVVLRFIGITPESSNIRPLLTSVISQIKRAYNINKPTPNDIKGLIRDLQETMTLAKPKKSLIIVLDSLDQFDPEGGALQLGWLPKQLPKNVKLLVSTLPEKQYECFPRLEALFKDKHSQFLEVPQVPEADVRSILNKWLKLEDRTLTTRQLEYVVKAFRKCPLPLYLKLCFDEACKWRSFSPPEDTRLEMTVRDVINTLFSNVEKSHGEILTSHALSYMTLSRSGLMEAELEDILSCDDEVLNDVYQYWKPPVRRLPPLLIVRIKADLQQYLVDRGADGVKVVYWYHRQFIEAANDRYCSDGKERRRRHTSIAEYFMGTWANGNAKPFIDPQSRKQMAKDRLVAAQPLKFEKSYNLRKLMELPEHLVEARQLKELKEHVLLNLDWLLAKLSAASFRDIVDDFNMARKAFPKDSDIKTAAEILQLSREAITNNPAQLPGQIMGRLDASKGMTSLRRQCQVPPVPCIIPDKVLLMPPGGQLKYVMKAHESDVTGLAMTADGLYAVTSAEDRKVKIWDVQEGRHIRIIEDLDEDLCNVILCCNDQYIVTASAQSIWVIRFDSGEIVREISGTLKLPGVEDEVDIECHYLGMAACGKDHSLLAVLARTWVVLFDVETGKRVQHLRDIYFDDVALDKDEYSDDCYDCSSYIVGNTNHLAIGQGRFLRIIDLNQQGGCQFSHNITVFEESKTDEDDTLTIDALTFSHNGSQVFISECMKNNLQIFNVKTGRKENQIEGNPKDYSEKFLVAQDGRHLYFPCSEQICVWNLDTKSRNYILNHHCNIDFVVSHDMKTVVTIGNGVMMRIWQTSDEDDENHAPNHDSDDQKIEGNRHNAYATRMVLNTFCPRYAITYLKANTYRSNEEEKDFHYDELIVYDLCLDKDVRSSVINITKAEKGSLSRNYPERIRCWELLDATSILCSVNRKLKVLDLHTMKFSRVFTGKLHRHSDDFALSGNCSVVVALSKSRRNLKVIDVKKGKTTAIAESGRQKRYHDHMMLNHRGTMAVVEDEDAFLWVVDLQTGSFLHKLTVPGKKADDISLSLSDSLVLPDGDHIIINISRDYDDYKCDGYLTCPSIWNLRTGQLELELVDAKAQKELEAREKTEDISCETTCLLDENTLAAGCEDHVIRLWDVNTGELIKRLEGHTYDVSEVKVSPDVKKRRYMLSTSDTVEENSLYIWDLEQHSCSASLRIDFDWDEVLPIGDGSVLKLLDQNSASMVTLTLCGPGQGESSKTLYPKPVLKGEKLGVELETMSPNDALDDPADLDQEEDEADDSGDDSSDEDSSSWGDDDGQGERAFAESDDSIDWDELDSDLDFDYQIDRNVDRSTNKGQKPRRRGR